MICKTNFNILLQGHDTGNALEFKGQCKHLSLPVTKPWLIFNFKINREREKFVSLITALPSHSVRQFIKHRHYPPFPYKTNCAWTIDILLCCSKIIYKKNVIAMTPCPIEEFV